MSKPTDEHGPSKRGCETKAFSVFPTADDPHDIRPLTAGGIGAMIAGLGQVRYDIERSMIEGARIMRLVTGAEVPRRA